jgi:UPF0271 protein
MHSKKLNINADMGEESALESKIMPLVSSCSIACGGHAGNVEQIERTMDLALQNNIYIGAHPSYKDKANFGRKKLALSQKELKSQLTEQLNIFYEIAQKKKVTIHHIKAHGALYHEISANEEVATTYLEVIKDFFKDIILYVPFGSIIYNLAKSHFETHCEAFIDRKYLKNGSLVKRSNPKGLIVDKHEAWEQVKSMVQDQQVTSIEQEIIPIHADTLCIHGDNPNAFEILQFIRNQETTIAY